MAPTEKQDELQGIALSLEGSKLTYVTPIGDDIEYKEMLIVRYDHVSGLHFVQWAGQASLQTECVAHIIKDHPNVVIESCPSDDALWTVEAQNMWAGLRDQDGGRIQRRASIKAKEKLAQESEEEEDDDPPPVAKKQKVAKEPPDEFKCPITLDKMTDPVVAEDGHTYERGAILGWFAALRVRRVKSPVTGVTIGDKIVPNFALKNMIAEWK